MSEVYDSLMEGLNEALAFARGEKTGAVQFNHTTRGLCPTEAKELLFNKFRSS